MTLALAKDVLRLTTKEEPVASEPDSNPEFIAAVEAKGGQAPADAYSKRVFSLEDGLAASILGNWSEPIHLRLRLQDDGTYALWARTTGNKE